LLDKQSQWNRRNPTSLPKTLWHGEIILRLNDQGLNRMQSQPLFKANNPMSQQRPKIPVRDPLSKSKMDPLASNYSTLQ
jgi:hypothetical protein